MYKYEKGILCFPWSGCLSLNRTDAGSRYCWGSPWTCDCRNGTSRVVVEGAHTANHREAVK